jgi:hypothetical protein
VSHGGGGEGGVESVGAKLERGGGSYSEVWDEWVGVGWVYVVREREVKGDGEGDLAQHGEAERCGDWKELTQELGREVEGAGAELVGVVSCQEDNVCFFQICFLRTGKIWSKTQILPVPRWWAIGWSAVEMRRAERRAMQSRMPGGHANAERWSGRAGMGRKGGKRRGAAGGARRRLRGGQRRVRELVSSGVQESGAVGRRRRERDVVGGAWGGAKLQRTG